MNDFLDFYGKCVALANDSTSESVETFAARSFAALLVVGALLDKSDDFNSKHQAESISMVLAKAPSDTVGEAMALLAASYLTFAQEDAK